MTAVIGLKTGSTGKAKFCVSASGKTERRYHTDQRDHGRTGFENPVC